MYENQEWERKGKKKVIKAKIDINNPHALPKDEGDAEMIKMSPHKPPFDSQTPPHASLE
jgi:hypothetical protein